MIIGLIAKGADPELKNNAGGSFRDMAMGDMGMTRVLERAEEGRKGR